MVETDEENAEGATPADNLSLPPDVLPVLLHAINGTGVGHLTRQTALARHLLVAQPRLYPIILSESPAAAEITAEIPTLQLPSTSYLRSLPASRPLVSDLLHSKVAMCMAALEQLRPRLVVHDTLVWPPLVQLSKLLGLKQVLSLRPRRDVASYLRDEFCPWRHMDFIFVPDSPHHYPEFADALEREGIEAMWTGPISRLPVLDSSFVRSQLGLTPTTGLVIVTSGGGSGDDSRRHFERCLRALQLLDPANPLSVVVVLGPLFPGLVEIPSPFPHRLLVMRVYPNLQDLFAVADVVICRGGYGTINEAVSSGATVLAAPASRNVDDQCRRVTNWIEDEGCALIQEDAPPEMLAAILADALSARAGRAPRTLNAIPEELSSRLLRLALQWEPRPRAIDMHI
jgi:predicted glycosyltransferase